MRIITDSIGCDYSYSRKKRRYIVKKDFDANYYGGRIRIKYSHCYDWPGFFIPCDLAVISGEATLCTFVKNRKP